MYIYTKIYTFKKTLFPERSKIKLFLHLFSVDTSNLKLILIIAGKQPRRLSCMQLYENIWLDTSITHAV